MARTVSRRDCSLVVAVLLLIAGCSDYYSSPKHPAPIGDTFRFLSGHVRDKETGRPIVGVAIAAAESVGAYPWYTDSTDADGYYSGPIMGLPVGFPTLGYLSFAHASYQPVVVSIDSVFATVYQEAAVLDVALRRSGSWDITKP